MTSVVTRPWQAFVHTVAARTPASRDRALDATEPSPRSAW